MYSGLFSLLSKRHSVTRGAGGPLVLEFTGCGLEEARLCPTSVPAARKQRCPVTPALHTQCVSRESPLHREALPTMPGSKEAEAPKGLSIFALKGD